ncbi:uncharacterized protein LOC123529903 isoform X1 [Mercenaria mercenaria]|uniref:uncharacterized protein LOC123529903 isoform X1 n=1 Tax=Mercenaria mercenaria TaxID=6596 RepID=UPI00234F7E62|nr:uncharacterized protein LOC123529903 isoform X1 [Mercenaria mercenaria]
MSTPAPSPLIYLYTNDIPVWLQVMLGITACVAALLLLTCLLLCCMRLCGCWTGNILGVGSLRRPMDDTDHLGCWCCRPHVVSSRSRIDDGQISYTNVLNTSRRSTPLTPRTWMPHTKPVRNNNTSTQ